MSRIFWDSMLLIYLLEDNPAFSNRADEILARARRRGDKLFTSCLALGEVVTGAEKPSSGRKEPAIRMAIGEMGFHFLPFDEGAVTPFALLRTRTKVKIADAIHLACAASAGIDLFLTGDKQLTKLDVPGIQFIVDFTSPVY